MGAVVDLDPVLQRGHRRRHRAGAELEPIGAARHQWLLPHPDDMRGELVGELGTRAGPDQEVAAPDVDVVGEGQRDRVAGYGALDRAVEGDDLVDRGLDPRSHRHDLVALRDHAGGDGAGDAAEIEVGAANPLHREAEAGRRAAVLDIDGFEVVEQRRPLVPVHPLRLRPDIVAETRRNRDRLQRGETETGGELAVALGHPVKDGAVEADKVELVDRHHHMANAEQRADQRMPPGLRNHPIARVDQQQREVGGRGAGRHVAGVLLMAGRVGDDERAPLGREKPVGDVDGDALLALVFEPVEQQRQVDVVSGGAEPLRLALEGRQLVGEDRVGVVEQPADQGRLAVIDRAAGEEAQQRLFRRGRAGRDGFQHSGHQK